MAELVASPEPPPEPPPHRGGAAAEAVAGTASREPTDDGEVASLRSEIAQLQAAVTRLQREKSAAEDRLEFVEELLGPTEAQRKAFQDQLCAARAASLQAHRGGWAVPVRFVGRLNEEWLRSIGLTERDCALLQRGCVTGPEGVPRDVSLLGDPHFKPYRDRTLEPLWEARGGLLKLSLGDVRNRWGEEVALEIVKCAIELDRHDASRRLGVELPWHETENRELDPAEVIELLERELAATRSRSSCSRGSAGIGLAPGSSLDETSSEVSSLDLLRRCRTQDDEAADSAAWSLMESDTLGTGGLDDTTDGSGAFGSPRPSSSATSIPPLFAVGDYCIASNERCGDEWSLADADIEQLLLGAGARAGRKSRSEVPQRSVGSTPRREYGLAAFAEFADDAGTASGEPDELGEVLRELLEEEVAGSLGHLIARVPRLGDF